PNADDLFIDFQKLVAEHNGHSSLIELGSRARSGNTYKQHFPTLDQYTGVDISPGDNVDLVGDLHQLSKAVNQRYDFALSISVFEHLLMPWVAATELNKSLKLGGIAYIQSHPAYPLHDEPWDFFRFSKEAWRGLFNHLTGFEVLSTAYSLPANIVPAHAMDGPLQGIDRNTTYLISACLVRKISDPEVDWSCNPSSIYDLGYSH
ncbi:MAG: methyltransferase domain-containing protein, partial [Pseudohongiellaceae bacterium]